MVQEPCPYLLREMNDIAGYVLINRTLKKSPCRVNAEMMKVELNIYVIYFGPRVYLMGSIVIALVSLLVCPSVGQLVCLDISRKQLISFF